MLTSSARSATAKFSRILVYGSETILSAKQRRCVELEPFFGDGWSLQLEALQNWVAAALAIEPATISLTQIAGTPALVAISG